MGISRVTNTDDRRVAHVVDEDGRPRHTVLLHQESEATGNMVIKPLPGYLRDPRWDGEQWREAHTWGSVVRILLWFALLAACLFFLVAQGHAQTNENIAKVGGVNQSGDNVIDTTNHAVKVNVVAGGGTGGGPSDAAATAAASESDTARQKVFSALRLLDTSQGAGSQLVTALGDQTSGLWINCKAGCTSATDNTTGTTALGALNATIAVALTGARGANFQLQAAGTLIGTITPQCSFDGGTIYNANGYIQDPFSGVVSTTAVVASAQATTDYPVMCPQGSSNARMKVTSFTSGTANFVARSTVATWPNLDWGIVTTSAPSYTTGQINGLSLNTAGGLRVDGSGATQPISAAALPLPTGAAADSSLTTIDTDLKANITLHAGTNVIGHVINDSGSTTAVTGNVTAVQATGSNLHVQVDTAPSTAVTNAGTFAAQATLQTQTDTTMVGGVNVKEINGVTPLMGNGTTGIGSQRVTIASDNSAFAVNATLQAGSALAGEVAPVATATTTDSALACNILSAASTNATNCKGSAGNFYGYEIYNTTTTVYYLRLYNTSSSPTCSSATGFIRSIPIQPAGAAGGVGGSISNQGVAVGYSTGISFCLTGGSSSTDNTNAAVGIFGEIRYK